MGVPRLVFPLQWQRRKRWRGMDRNGLRCTRGDRQTVVEFLGIIEITISRQGDREESIRPDGNFEIHRAEIFPIRIDGFPGIRPSTRTRGNSIPIIFFPVESSVQVVDSKASRVESCCSFDRFVTQRKEENNLNNQGVNNYSCICRSLNLTRINLSYRLLPTGPFCINKIPIFRKVPCVSRLATRQLRKKNRRSTKIDLAPFPFPSMKNRVISAITKSERSARAKESKNAKNERSRNGRKEQKRKKRERERNWTVRSE